MQRALSIIAQPLTIVERLNGSEEDEDKIKGDESRIYWMKKKRRFKL